MRRYLPTQYPGARNDMPEANSQEKSKTNGEVRIRSNVCTDPNAWHLVPGDVVKSFSLPRDRLTQKQKDEMMYYARCCICHRTIFEIEEDGCDESVCHQQGIPSSADAKRRRKYYLDNAESAQR